MRAETRYRLNGTAAASLAVALAIGLLAPACGRAPESGGLVPAERSTIPRRGPSVLVLEDQARGLCAAAATASPALSRSQMIGPASLLLVESGKVMRYVNWPDLPESLQARDAEQVRLLLCIARESVVVGQYHSFHDPGEPEPPAGKAYRIDRHAALLTWPDGLVIDRADFRGGDPPKAVIREAPITSRSDAGSDPLPDLLRWLSARYPPGAAVVGQPR